jgi:hypothetical protein
MAFQSLLLPIVSVFRSVGIQAARGALGGLNKDFETFAKQAGKAGLAFAGMQALMSSTQFISQSVELTQQYERNMLALGQVFQQLTPQMAGFTKEVQNYGIGQAQAAQASVFLGSVLKQYGLDQEQVSTQTQKLVKLSQDLATTYGYDLQEALLAMTALFRGEYDPIEKFGVAMKQSEINAYLAARGLDNLEGSALMLEQVQARLNLLYDRSADAQGAYTRASDTLYVSQQNLAAAVQNLQVAFGEPLQKPLSGIINSFSEIVSNQAPAFVDIANAIGNALDDAAPTIKLVGELFLQLLQPMQQVIEAVGLLIKTVAIPLNIALTLIVTGLEKLNYLLDAVSILFGALDTGVSKFLNTSGAAFLTWLDDAAKDSKIIGFFVSLGEEIDKGAKKFEDFVDRQRNNKATETSRDMAMLSNAIRNYSVEAEDAVPKVDPFVQQLTDLGVYSTDAEGKLTGLAGVFGYIAEEAAKSDASSELEAMGFNASQIEYFLTKPDWAKIFGEISRLAKIAALDISKVGSSIGGAAMIVNAQDALNKLLESELGGSPTPSGGPSTEQKDSIKEFFNSLQDEINKQAARIKLERMGASEGLINLILGKDDWGKLWAQIKTGEISLASLQKKFNSTADGVKELEDRLQKAIDARDEFIDGLNDTLLEAEQKLAEVTAAADELQAALYALADTPILPTFSREIGQFEQQIIGLKNSVEQTLADALSNKSLFQAGYDELYKFAQDELMLLETNARQRDELFKKYEFTKDLINQYRAAVTGALSLTGLFNKLTKETEKRTVTEVQKGLLSLESSAKTFAVSISRSYEETIDKVTDKTGALLDGFRAMADKSRAFAANLKVLRDLGLDPMLFNQLVEAGVEAGGETAQAIVDGGKDAVTELNNIFEEIDRVGGELGLDSVKTFYDSGDKLMDSLLEGIKSKQTELETLAQSLASSFSENFKAKIDIAVDAPVKAQEKVVAGIEAQIEQAKAANVDAIAQVQDLIAGAQKYISSGKLTSEQLAGATAKLGAYTSLLTDVTSGQVQDISGISSGMSSAALLEAAKATGGTTVNNYAISIQPGDRLQQNQTMETLNKFASNNGPISSWVAV